MPLHEGNRANAFGKATQVVQANHDAPVMKHEHHIAQPQRIDEAIDVRDMVLEPVGDVRLTRLPHANEINRDYPGVLTHCRQDPAPQER